MCNYSSMLGLLEGVGVIGKWWLIFVAVYPELNIFMHFSDLCSLVQTEFEQIFIWAANVLRFERLPGQILSFDYFQTWKTRKTCWHCSITSVVGLLICLIFHGKMHECFSATNLKQWWISLKKRIFVIHSFMPHQSHGRWALWPISPTSYW